MAVRVESIVSEFRSIWVSIRQKQKSHHGGTETRRKSKPFETAKLLLDHLWYFKKNSVSLRRILHGVGMRQAWNQDVLAPGGRNAITRVHLRLPKLSRDLRHRRHIRGI